MHEDSIFLTLTYASEFLPKNNTLVKRDLQLFLKRLRKNLAPRKIRFFASGEYGEKGGRPHYHLILFSVGGTDRRIIEHCWPHGLIHIGSVDHNSCNYVAKYCVKKLSGPAARYYDEKGIIPEFALMSRKPGIGLAFVEKNKNFLTEKNFCIVKGNKYNLPRYYVDKLFDDAQKIARHALAEEEKKKRLIDEIKYHNFKAGYEVRVFEKQKSRQVKTDLEARENLKRRKL